MSNRNLIIATVIVGILAFAAAYITNGLEGVLGFTMLLLGGTVFAAVVTLVGTWFVHEPGMTWREAFRIYWREF